jgi:phosphotransferase system HPr (HPr) family protein
MPVAEVVVMHSVGLHARPAAEFVKLAASFPCEIKVCNLTADSKFVNAKSILSVLTLGVQQAHRVRIETSGERDEEALQALITLIESNFGEAQG